MTRFADTGICRPAGKSVPSLPQLQRQQRNLKLVEVREEYVYLSFPMSPVANPDGSGNPLLSRMTAARFCSAWCPAPRIATVRVARGMTASRRWQI